MCLLNHTLTGVVLEVALPVKHKEMQWTQERSKHIKSEVDACHTSFANTPLVSVASWEMAARHHLDTHKNVIF